MVALKREELLIQEIEEGFQSHPNPILGEEYFAIASNTTSYWIRIYKDKVYIYTTGGNQYAPEGGFYLNGLDRKTIAIKYYQLAYRWILNDGEQDIEKVLYFLGDEGFIRNFDVKDLHEKNQIEIQYLYLGKPISLIWCENILSNEKGKIIIPERNPIFFSRLPDTISALIEE